MKEELNILNNLFEENKSNLPLVLQDISFKEKIINISGKSIEVSKYRTTIFPIDKYYKNVIRI